MAFFCPVRIGRGKKKKNSTGNLEAKELRNNTFTGIGRITGSSSIETLVRVGIEKENGLSPDSKMVVLHDFMPCVDDELQVNRGQVVNVLYRENDWVYVIAEDSHLEGFIPHSYCMPYNSYLNELALNNFKKKLPRNRNSNEIEVDINVNADGAQSTTEVSDSKSCNKKLVTVKQIPVPSDSVTSSQASLHSASSQLDVHPFLKDPSGRFIVLYTFTAQDENDISVEREEFITVLNKDDPDWYWIIRSNGQEGFVPSGFIYPVDILQDLVNQNNQGSSVAMICNTNSHKKSSKNICMPLANVMSSSTINPENSTPITTSVNGKQHYHGTEFVVLYDYKAQTSDDLSVKRGDWVYADLNNQTIDGWLWAFAPKTRKHGFIPKAYTRCLAMTHS